MSRLTWFEIHAAEPARAMRFYAGLLGWSFDSFGDDYWLIRTGDASKPGIDGGLMPRRGPAPAEGAPVNAYTCVVSVDDVDVAVARIPELGGAIVVPKFAVPSVGWLAYARDTEGNLFGVMTMDERAA
jgi:predicted enzyme related to lactoylglutathione lyase